MRRALANWDMGFVDDAACSASIHDLLEGRMAEVQFMDLMRAWKQDKKEAPY